jgi:signal transduction histidine kinase
MLIVLEGKGGLYVDRGGGRRKVTEFHAGDVTGFLPFSRMGPPSGDPLIDEAAVVLAVHRDHFPEMIRECPAAIERLVHAMVDRVRHFASTYWQDDKMMSLGRLSAGLSHELNNPASAAARSAQQLGDVLTEMDSAVSGARRRASHRTINVRSSAPRARGERRVPATPLERADRERALPWLARASRRRYAAAALADTGITRDMLDELREAFRTRRSTPPSAGSRRRTPRGLAADVERATRRIHDPGL